MARLRALLKRAAERALTLPPIPQVRLRSRRHDTLVLAYHNIIPHGEPGGGDASLHLPQRDFARQLDMLLRTHDVVSLADLHKPATGKARAIITFDDAYAGALDAGVTELRKRGLPATIFVTPSFIGGGHFWWDALAVGDTGLPADVREHALVQLAGRTPDVLAWANARGLHVNEAALHQTGASEAALKAAAASGSITFGAHTWSHANLAALPLSDTEGELRRPMEWLRARFTNVLPYIAYPYGLRSRAVAELVAQTGYSGAFLVEGGWTTAAHLTTSPFELPRWNVPAAISIRGFQLRISGVL